VAAQGETLRNANKKNMNPEGVQFQEWTLLLIRAAPFQGACFVRSLPSVSPWALLDLTYRSVVSGFIIPAGLYSSAPSDDTFIALSKQLPVEFDPLQVSVTARQTTLSSDNSYLTSATIKERNHLRTHSFLPAMTVSLAFGSRSG